MTKSKHNIRGSDVDPHHLDADPDPALDADPDPALDADPDPDLTKNRENTKLEKIP